MSVAADSAASAVATAPLAARLPPPDAPVTSDELLSRFLEYVADTGLELYPAQEEALLELMAGKHVILNTPTGSGKSLVAAALHFKAMAEGRRSFYTSPIKALASEKFFALCELFGAKNVGMLTGDASINRDAPIVCCTAEVLANMALREGARAAVDYAVLDEFHYYSDRDRGVAWEIPLIALPRTTFLLMSATIGNAEFFEQQLALRTGRPAALVRSEQRPVPLDFEYRETPLHETVEDLITKGRYPVYIVNFTQRAVAEEAQNLMSTNFCTREEKAAINEALATARFDSPYGKEIQKFVRHGIGLHHAGLLPKYRLMVEKLSQKGLLKVICGTDTLGVGVNIPIRTVLFTKLCKYDGEKTAILSVRDFKQIGGRAGRKGFDDHGYVVAQAPEHVIENLKLEAKAGGDPAKLRKIVRRKPPEKGYVPWDKGTFARLMSSRPEDLKSRFAVTHGMLLNLLQGAGDEVRPGGYGRLIELINLSHLDAGTRRANRRQARVLFKSLRDAGVIRVVPRDGVRGSRVIMGEGIDQDFSLNHALSLYLVETLAKLDPELPSYALDIVTLVESVLENPEPVLMKQLDKLKTQKLDELKAQGVEYEQRMEELEKLEYPKPNRDFIYATFNDFAARHPWVGAENIRPKSVAREMYELFYTFDEYVRDYSLQRSEGLVLRYLHDVYKSLVQNVPETYKTEELHDVLAYLRTMVRSVDSSLLDEWEGLQDPAGAAAKQAAARDAQAAQEKARATAEAERKAFTARVRSEVHRLLKALAARDYEDAARCVDPGQGQAWTPEGIEKEMAGYWAENETILLDQEARSAKHTRLEQMDEQEWRVEQTLLDADGPTGWVVACYVDRALVRDPGAPLIELRRVTTAV